MGLRAASRMDVKSGDAGDAWSSAIDFDFPTWFVSAESWNANLDLQLSYDGSQFYDTFKVDPDRPILFPFQAKSIKVKNTQAGAVAEYQVAGVD